MASGRSALVVLGSSSHQRGTTNENSVGCRPCTNGSAKRRSLDEHAVSILHLGVHEVQNCHSRPKQLST